MLKIAFFITNDYIFTYPLLKEVIQRLKVNHNIKGIVELPDTLVGLKGIQIYIKYLEIFGIATFIKLALISIHTRLQILTSFLLKKQFYSFRQMAQQNHIPFFTYDSPNNKELIQWVINQNIDIIIIFIGHRLYEEIIKAPNICIINKHGSLLPSNRGVLPVFWAMLNDEEIGFSLHIVNNQIDAGDILYQKQYVKKPFSMYKWYQIMYSDAVDAIIEVIKRIEKNNIQKIKNNIVKPSYHSLPTKQEVQEFYEKGLKII